MSICSDDVLKLLPNLPWEAKTGPKFPVREDFLRALQYRIGFSLPAIWVDWLRACNGGAIGSQYLFGVQPQRDSFDVEWSRAAYPDWWAQRWIPVAGDGCGNYYVLLADGADQPVVFFDTIQGTDAPAYVAASNLWAFLWFFLHRELAETGWPFDRDFVLTYDPELAHCNRGPLPWNA